MQKNLFKYIALFFAIIAIFYFFKKNQNPSIEADIVTENTETFENALPKDFHSF